MSNHAYEPYREHEPRRRKVSRLPQLSKSNRLMRRYYAELYSKQKDKERRAA